MSNKLKIYIGTIILCSIAFLTIVTVEISDLITTEFLFFMILSIITESLLIAIPNQGAVSVGFAINLLTILLFGVPQACIIGCIGMTFRVFESNGRRVHILNMSFYKTLFNGANIILCTGISGLCYEYAGGIPGHIELGTTFLPMILCICVYILINATIMSGLMHFLTGETFLYIWYKNIIWIVKNYFALASISIIMAVAYIKYDKLGVLLFFGPLLLARFTFKQYIDMKSMYIETVKSLCAAMEAKDPYTQGHSARVSDYAGKLAKKLRLSKTNIENLKIAGKLHDIGKIGIDESVLKKPGKLLPEEFEMVKQHSSIGYNIIHEINFLQDISRCILNHHERYDGYGYPNGMKGDAIGIDACILSICDVYDALTSDRPYRKAMTVDEALEIIKQSRAKQFDPNVTDAFIEMVRQERVDKNAS